MIALDKRSRGGSIKKLDKDTYVNTITGEVSKFKHNETRRDNKRELLRTFSKLRDVINTNVTNPENCKWITLTYKENMQDTQRLYKDIDKFNKKLRYVYGHYEYIIVIEPQERGAWHAHCILIFPDKAPYMPNDNVAKLWANGFTQTKALQNIDNVGAYLTAYLTDIVTDDPNANTKTYKDENGNLVSKKIKKGGRLALYPTGMNLYRHSRGIKKPEVKSMKYRDFMTNELPEDASLTYSKTKTIEKGDFKNTIIYRVYKLKSKPVPPLDNNLFFMQKIKNGELVLVTDKEILECFS